MSDQILTPAGYPLYLLEGAYVIPKPFWLTKKSK